MMSNKDEEEVADIDKKKKMELENRSIHVEMAAHGLLESLQGTEENSSLVRIQSSLADLCDKQTELADSISFDNDKLCRAQQSGTQPPLSKMLERTQVYHTKLTSLKREMSAIAEQSHQMKLRAFKLQESKQREALKRELERQREAEKEALLVAQPEHL